MNDAVLSSSSGDKPKASGLGSSISYNPSPEIMLEIMLGEVRDAGRKTACSLLNVIEGNHLTSASLDNLQHKVNLKMTYK